MRGRLMSLDDDARADWEERIGRHSDRDEGSHARRLPAPGGVEVRPGVGQITVDFQTVPGALAYAVHRADDRDGEYSVVDFQGGDVLVVPGPPFADTTVEPARIYWYRVAALAATEVEPDVFSDAVSAQALASADEPAVVRCEVDVAGPTSTLRRPWRMLGSEHLSQLGYEERTGGQPIGAEFTEALRMARDELGATHVRAHAILHDELGVYRDGEHPKFEFARVDEVYDRVLELGYTPIVELSFMPADLAREPEATVFDYRAIISPPREWGQWEELIGRLVRHLVKRYGLDEVRRWAFEVWNEPNLEVFWTGSQEEYFRLYATAARVVKAVDEQLLVGGPSTAQSGWVADFLDHVAAEDLPLDFVTTHVYGTYPTDVRAVLAARGLDEVKVWWTEWGITPRHFDAINDRVFAAPFVLHGMKAAQRNADALAYWVVSDHFEELGRPPELFHGGFGLLTVGNLRKARYRALMLAEELADEQLPLTLSGDGARSLVDAWATRASEGTVDVLAWNGTLDQTKQKGEPALDRRVEVVLDGLSAARYTVTLARIDAEHSNIAAVLVAGDWPTDEEWQALRAADTLDEAEWDEITPEDGTARLAFDLPMPGVARLRLRPV